MAVRAMIGLLGAGVLSGCGSTLGSLPVIGEPDHTPPAPAVIPDFPRVADAPAGPATKPLAPAERAKIEAELAAARTRAAQEKREQINRAGAR